MQNEAERGGGGVNPDNYMVGDEGGMHERKSKRRGLSGIAGSFYPPLQHGHKTAPVGINQPTR